MLTEALKEAIEHLPDGWFSASDLSKQITYDLADTHAILRELREHKIVEIFAMQCVRYSQAMEDHVLERSKIFWRKA